VGGIQAKPVEKDIEVLLLLDFAFVQLFQKLEMTDLTLPVQFVELGRGHELRRLLLAVDRNDKKEKKREEQEKVRFFGEHDYLTKWKSSQDASLFAT
ncbi:MAG: hypothetical protein ACE5JC_08770, partial [Candidatus Zixiibacteriota bacterium]